MNEHTDQTMSVMTLRSAMTMGEVLDAWRMVRTQDEANFFIAAYATVAKGGIEIAVENLRFGMNLAEFPASQRALLEEFIVNRNVAKFAAISQLVSALEQLQTERT